MANPMTLSEVKRIRENVNNVPDALMQGAILTLCDAYTELVKAARESIKDIPDKDPSGREYWEWGNYDDCYNYGVEVGEYQMATHIRTALALLLPENVKEEK